MKKIIVPGAFNIRTHNEIICKAWRQHMDSKGAAVFIMFGTTEQGRIELLAAPAVPIPELIHRLKEAIGNLEKMQSQGTADKIILPS